MSKSETGFTHQDWTVVTLSKHKKSKKPVSSGPVIHAKRTIAGKNIQTDLPNLAKLDVDDIVHPELASANIAKQIQTYRLEMGLKQDELNNRCSFPAGTVAKYERGDAQYKQSEVNKMAKIFGKPLKK